jgi:hypothetical protein
MRVQTRMADPQFISRHSDPQFIPASPTHRLSCLDMAAWHAISSGFFCA